MKTKILKLSAIVLLFSLMAFSCEKEKLTNENNPCSDSYEIADSLNKMQGIIGFDEINKSYFISFYVEGTIDEIITAYPCVLSEKFRTVNMKVRVSGNLFKSENLPTPVVGGQEVFNIDIKEIELIQEKN